MVGQGINEGSYFRGLMTGGWIEGMNTDIRKYVVRQHGNQPAVSDGILDDKVRHRAVRPAPRVSACDGGCRSVRAPPVGAGHRPPSIGPDITFAGFFNVRDVTGGGDELCKIPVRDLGRVHAKRCDCDPAQRFVRVPVCIALGERAAR